jgi:gliding motility-associated-like protein
VTVIDTSGCSITARIILRVDKTREVYIPNAFSPNGDGTNDRIMIFANAEKIIQVNTFRIFDRWGEIVFEANDFQPNDPKKGWDGFLNGEKLNPAVFVYFAEIEFIDGVTILYKGDVTLMQ